MKLDTSINFNKEKILSKLESTWKKIYKIVFFLLLFGAIIFGAYIWRENLYLSTWDDNQVQSFRNTQDKGTVFNENNYKKALDVVNQRNQESGKPLDSGRNFFLTF
ncbi:MAG: hypothetical protein WCF93_04275 [Candidatus Moraniibacteriota bacterium]